GTTVDYDDEKVAADYEIIQDEMAHVTDNFMMDHAARWTNHLDSEYRDYLRRAVAGEMTPQEALDSFAEDLAEKAGWEMNEEGFFRMKEHSLDEKIKVGERSKKPKNKKSRYHRALKRSFWMFILPSGLLFGIFFLLPLILNILMSLTNFDGWKTMDFIGLENYQRALKDRDFYLSLRRTFTYTLVNLPFKVGIPLVLATLLTSERVRFKTLTRTAIYIPVLLSPLVAGITINWIFSQEYGVINFVIQQLGGNPIAWASSRWLATFVISVANNWM